MVEKEKTSRVYKKIFVIVLVFLGAVSFTKEKIFAHDIINLPVQRQVSQNVLSVQTKFSSVTPTISTVASSESQKKEVTKFQLKIPILMYHHIRQNISVTNTVEYSLSIDPKVLEEQFKYLHESGFQTLSLNDLYDSLENQQPLPPKSVVLTFDDGYRDFYTEAFPLLKKYNLRAVSFYVVGYFEYPGYMNLAMLKEINASGLVDVESHTLNHFELTKMPPIEQRREIFESKRILETVLNKKINYFAYPYGDLNDQVVNLVNEAGYRLAFGTRPGNKLVRSEKYTLRRVAVSGFNSLDTFKAKVGN